MAKGDTQQPAGPGLGGLSQFNKKPGFGQRLGGMLGGIGTAPAGGSMDLYGTRGPQFQQLQPYRDPAMFGPQQPIQNHAFNMPGFGQLRNNG